MVISPPEERLHCQKTHITGFACVYQVDIRLRSQIAERKLQRFVQAAFHRLGRDGQAVVGNADVADLALGFGFQRGVIQAVFPVRFGAERRVVELVNINSIGL